MFKKDAEVKVFKVALNDKAGELESKTAHQVLDAKRYKIDDLVNENTPNEEDDNGSRKCDK